MILHFLGTSCMVPTKERNHSAQLLLYKNEGILIDCGEGTQRQLKIAGIKPTKITKILISHWHGDHTLGLPGLLQTMGASEYQGTLKIIGPKGTSRRIASMMDAFVFDSKISLEIVEIDKVKVIETSYFVIEARQLDHSVLTYGFSFIEKDRRRVLPDKAKDLGIPHGPLMGKVQSGEDVVIGDKKISASDVTRVVKGRKISIISDTLLCKGCYDLANSADLLICEAAYASDLEEKARNYKHMTARQAAQVASKSDVKRLVLTHFSQRYKDTKEIEEDAKDVFKDVICAYDFLKIKI